MIERKRTKRNSLGPIFYTGNKEVYDLRPADIFIIPEPVRPDELGLSVRCKIAVKIVDDLYEHFDGYCAIYEQLNTFEALSEIKPEGEIEPTELKQPFATMLADAKSYSILYKVLGPFKTKEILKTLNDVAMERNGNTPPRWYEFFKSEQFTHGFTRSSESYFAFRNAYRIINGLSLEITDTRQAFSIKLIGRGPRVTFDFLFDEKNFFRGRIAVIIGQNGTGKTASLAKIAKGLADVKSKQVKLENNPEFNQVIVFIHTSSKAQFRPSSSTGLAKAKIFTFNPGAPTGASADPLTQLLVDVVRSSEAMRPSLGDLLQILDEEFPGLSLMIPMRNSVGEVDLNTTRNNYISLSQWLNTDGRGQLLMYAQINHYQPLLFVQEDGEVRALSLGQLSFLRFILTAFANAGPSSIFLIDEPENFLHPNLISRFMRSLNKLLELTSSIAIVATHSPFVVREVQSAQVHVMAVDGGSLKISKPRMQTLGANVSSISNEVFGDDLPTHLYEELIQHARNNSQSFSDALNKFAGELSTEALMSLRRAMEQEA